MRNPVLIILLGMGLAACGGTTVPPRPDGGVLPDGGAVADGGPTADGGATSAGGCPPPADGGTPARDVLVMDPRDGRVLRSIDLSCFSTNADRLPRAYVMARIGTKVYVALQDFDATFSNFQNGKIAVIDATTDRVLRKIDLANKKNVNDLHVGPDGKLYVVAQGILGLDFPGFVVEQELSGGIDIVDPSLDAVVASIDDDAFGGNVTLVTTASSSRGYAVVAHFDQTRTPRENVYHVKRWNPAERSASAESLYRSPGAFLSSLLYDAASGTILVGENDFSNPRVVAIRERDGVLDETRHVALALGPQGMDLYAHGGVRKLVVTEPDFVGGVGFVQSVDLGAGPPWTAVTADDPVSSDPLVRVTRTLEGIPLVFAVNRLGADNIQWLDPEDGFNTRRIQGTKAQWSTGNGSGPQDVLAVSEEKVYVTLQR